MTPEQYAELLNFIQRNNGWKDSFDRDNIGEVPFIKYVSCHYDTRDGTVYKVIIRDGERGSKVFKVECAQDYDNFVGYLVGEESVYTIVD